MSPARLHWLCRCISNCFLPTKFLLWVEKLCQGVLTHPDQSVVTYVLDGLQNGFRVGFNSASVSLKSTTHNMSSASLQPLVIDDYLHTELAKGRVAGPFSSPLLPYLHISRFWVIPTKYQPGKWRLILDLSSPDGHTVNDGIRKGPFTVQYIKIDDIIDRIMSLGRDTLLAKFDVESAYRIIPIHLNDCYPKKNNQANGACFWIFLVLMVTLWMTALEKALHCSIYDNGRHWRDHVTSSGHFACEVWCGKCLPHYSHTPQWSLSSWHAVASQLFCGHGLIFWFPFSALNFFFSFGPGGMGSQKTVWRELSPSLSGRFPHPGPSYLSDLPTEPRHLIQ